jgi:hypothetical protein
MSWTRPPPGATSEQAFEKEAAVAMNEIKEYLEDEVRSNPAAAVAGAEGEPAALRAMTAKRKAAALATKWATRLQVVAEDGVTIAAKWKDIRGVRGRYACPYGASYRGSS